MNRIAIALLLFLSACTFEPRYRRPCTDPPCAWRTWADDSSTCCNLRWWEALGDPVLDQLIALALLNNNDLQVAAWRVCEYAARYQIAFSPLYPQINFEADALKQKYPTTSFLPSGINPIQPLYSFKFTASYELDLWGLIRSQAHAAYAELLEQVENRRTVVLTLVSAVAHGYVYLRQLDMDLEIAKKTLESRKESLELARIRFEGGLTSQIEVAQAASLYEETLADVVNLEGLIPQQENLISVLIGEPPACIFRGRSVDEFLLPPCIPAGLPSELLERRPDIRAAEDKLVATNAEIGAARAAFFPQITITGFYGASSNELKNLFSQASRMWQIGGQLLQPLFTGGKLTGQLKEAIAIDQEAAYNYRQVVLNAFKEVDDSLVAHQTAKEEVIVEERRVYDLKLYLELAWLRYYEGETDYLTVLDAERHLFAAEIDLANAQSDVFLTLIDIYKALGGGWVVDADCNLR